MRAGFFKLLLNALERHTPGCVKSIQIQILLNATAAAFGRPKKRVWHLSGREALAAYAACTAAWMSDCTTDRRRIFQCAYRLGRKIRRITGFSEAGDRERLVRYLYRNIGIKVTGHLPGEIIISSCYFSHVYTPEQCRTMSLMDRGIISGICGGGKLVFTERMTQGCGRCRAYLTEKGRKTDERCSE